MAVDERARHQLFVKLEHTLGSEEAITLMEHLPLGGYVELATKSDIAAVRQEILAMKQDVLAEIRQDISNQTRTIVFALVAVVVSLCSVALFR